MVDQTKLHEYLGGDITFVGAIPELNCVAVARREGGGELNAHLLGESIDGMVRGAIYLVGVDADGEGIDLDLTTIEMSLNKRS